MQRGFALCLLLLAACGGRTSEAHDGGRRIPQVRIRLVAAGSAATARITTSGPWTMVDARDGHELDRGAALDRPVDLAGAHLDHPRRLHGEATPLSVDGTAYPGDLLLLPADGGVSLVDETDLESYVAGVLAGELGTGFPAAALRAQAIAARTYALARIRQAPGAPWHLTDDTDSQVYRGLATSDALLAAAKDTAGMVLFWGGKLLPAYYHSTCGGRTASAVDVFGGPDVPPLSGTACTWCRGSTRYRWSIRLPLDEVARALDLPAPPSAVRIQSRSADGRARVLRFLAPGPLDRSAADLRSRLGPRRVPATDFLSVAIEGKELVIEGAGYGHGVGMCQWGAVGMARSGAGAADILARYYPSARLSRVY